MTIARRFVATAFLLSALTASPAAADETAEPTADRSTSFRKALLSDEFAIREKAMREMAAEGLPVKSIVVDAAAASDRELSLRGFYVLSAWSRSDDAALRDAAESALDELVVSPTPHVARRAVELQHVFAEAALAKLIEQGAEYDESSRVLTIDDAWKGEPADFKLLRKMSFLQRLELEGARFDDVWVESLRNAPIERLEFDGACLTAAGMEALATMPRLEALWLRETYVAEDALAKLATAPALAGLSFDGVPIQSQGLAALKAMPGLRAIRLSRTRLASGDFAMLVDFPALKTLDVRRTKFNYDDLLDVSASRTLTKVFAGTSRLDPVDFEDFQRSHPHSALQIDFDSGVYEDF